jgi:prepilin-type N-terminal cleavage/methylation domain-containing protein/prepilin-type processing-associated H-X9-DG protein
MSAARRKPTYGFTLVELLVVIGIIALLISILLPALGRARESAASVKCVSNMRQIALAFLQYNADSKGRGMGRPILNPPLSDGGGYIMYVLTENGYLNLQRDPQVQICPSATEQGIEGTVYGPWPATQVRFGNVRSKWYRNFDSRLEAEGSYTYNGWAVYGNNQSGTGTTLQNTLNRGTLFFVNITKMRDSTTVPFMGDGIWSEAFGIETTLPAPSSTDPVPWTNSADLTINRFYLSRHNKGINMVFMDGHGENISNLFQLWRLRHHAQWDVNLVPASVKAKW